MFRCALVIITFSAWSQTPKQLETANQIALECHKLIPVEYNKDYDSLRKEDHFRDLMRGESWPISHEEMADRVYRQLAEFDGQFNESFAAKNISLTETDQQELYILARAFANLAPALETKYGNCAQLGLLAGLFALKSGQFNRIELVQIEEGEYRHNFLVLDRPTDSILQQPDTWGSAIIIDVWGRGVEEIGVYTTSFQSPELLIAKFGIRATIVFYGSKGERKLLSNLSLTSQNLDWYALSNNLSSEALKKVYLEFIEEFYRTKVEL